MHMRLHMHMSLHVYESGFMYAVRGVSIPRVRGLYASDTTHCVRVCSMYATNVCSMCATLYAVLMLHRGRRVRVRV